MISIFLLLNITGCAQNKSNTMEQEEKQVVAITDRLTELMIARDLDELNELLDKNFTLTHITGYVQPKAEWLKEIETESMKYYSFQPIKREVEINGDKAQVVQQNILDARIWGTRNNWHLQQIYQLEKRNGDWVILKSVASIF